MITVGIYGIADTTHGRRPTYTHDHSIALMRDGRFLTVVQLERWTGRKHDNRISAFIGELLGRLVPVDEKIRFVSVNAFVGSSFISLDGNLRIEPKREVGISGELVPAEVTWYPDGLRRRYAEGWVLCHEFAYLASLLPFIDRFQDGSLGKNFIKSSLELLLGYKSLSLSATRNMLESVRNSKDTSLKRILQDWITQKKILSKQYTLPTEFRTKNLKGIEAEAEATEKEIIRRSSSFKNQTASLHVTMREVQTNMAEDEAAIEFLHFKLYRNGKTDSSIYAAYLFRKYDSVPVFMPLCEKQVLKRLFDSAGNSATTMVSSFYRGIEIKNTCCLLGQILYKLIWAPLEPHLKGIKKIAYSPSGKLYAIAFHALMADSKTLLMDKYKLQQYTSTRQIAFRTETKTSAPGHIVLFGDADFSMDSLQLTRLRRDNTVSAPVTHSVFQSTSTWPGLPGTGAEGNNIKQLFDQNKVKAKVFTKVNASEENLKAISNTGYKEIHIATHGFFLPDPEDSMCSTISIHTVVACIIM